MHIDSYTFGKIIIDGKEHTRDLLIFPDGQLRENWKRIESHELAPEDIEEIISVGPDIFIMGTGYSGVLEVLPETKKLFKENGIDLHFLKTGDAVNLFNELYKQKDKKVAAGFHLTC